MTFYYVATEICRLKWNWLYLIILHSLESIGYSSPLPSLHQFVTNPTAQQLNGTGREVRSPCYLDYSYIHSSPVWISCRDETLSSLNYAPWWCSQNLSRVLQIYLYLGFSWKPCISPVESPRFYHKALSKLASPEPDMSLSSKSCIYHSQSNKAL